MKKILSVVLAVMMIFAVMVPAFAVDITINQDTEQDGTNNAVIVKTSKEDASGVIPETYTVTIPATTTIPWNDTDGETLTYKVTTTLDAANKLQITVAYNGVMTSANTNETLAYTLTGNGVGTAADFGAYLVDAPTTLTAKVTAWDKAIDEYSDTLTFTADIVAA